jgi:hypothetical protein
MSNPTGFACELRSCVYCVDVDDHRLLKANDPILIDEQSICVEVTCARMFVEAHEVGKDKTISLYFDQGEDFMHNINQVWERRKNEPGWPRQIAEIKKVSRERYHEIQGVDVLAWIGRRNHTHQDVGPYQIFFALSSFCNFQFMDYERMKSQPGFFRPQPSSITGKVHSIDMHIVLGESLLTWEKVCNIGIS